MNGKTDTNGNSCSDVQEVELNRNCGRRSSSPPSYQQALLQLQRSRSPFYRGTEKPLTVRELRQLQDPTHRPTSTKPLTGSEVTHRTARNECVQPPQGVFYGQNATTLILKKQKSHSIALDGHRGQRTLPLPRRASEPSKVSATSPPCSLTLDRPRSSKARPKDGSLRVSQVEPNHAEPRFCLSPSATRAVRDYFSSQQGEEDADACLRRSQEVTLAIVQGKRDWQSRRCSDPPAEDFDQLFFAEESYV